MKSAWKNDTVESWSNSARFGDILVSVYISKNEGKWFGGIKTYTEFISPTNVLKAKTAKEAMKEMMQIFTVYVDCLYSRMHSAEIK